MSLNGSVVDRAPREQCYRTSSKSCTIVGTLGVHHCEVCNGFWEVNSYHCVDVAAPYFFLPPESEKCRYGGTARVDVLICELGDFTVLN